MATNPFTTMVEEPCRGFAASKLPCRVLTSSNIARTGVGTLDGVALQEGDRVLCIGQTNGAHNGPWVVTAAPTGWVRPTDFSEDRFVSPGCEFRILAGSAEGRKYFLSSPTTGRIILGQTQLQFAQGEDGSSGDVVETRAFDSILDRTSTYFQEFTGDGSSPCVLSLLAEAVQPPELGSQIVTYIPPNSASGLLVASNLGNGSGYPTHWDVFDPASGFVVVVTSFATGLMVTSGIIAGDQDITAPSIVSATINVTADDQALIVEWNRPMICPSFDGLNVTASSGPTLIQSVSGEGTATLTFGLSDPVAGDATCQFQVSTPRTLQSLNGQRAAAEIESVTILGGFETADLTGRTLHLRADLGNGSLADGGQFASWASQVGSITYAQATGGNRPVLDVDGVNGALASANSDGSDDYLTTATTLSTLVGGAGNNYYIAGILRANGTLGTGVGYNANAAIISDPAGWWALLLHDLGAGASELILYHHDGSIKTISSANGGAITAGRITTGTDFHFAVRLVGGSLRTYINGALTNTLGSVGALSASGLASSTSLFRAYVSGNPNPYLQARLHELVFCNPDPGDTQHNQLMDYYSTLLA